MLNRICDGDGNVGDIINFISTNKYTIGNIASTASSVSDTIDKVGNTTFDLVKKARELRKPAISDDAMNKVLNSDNTLKTGNGFFYV